MPRRKDDTRRKRRSKSRSHGKHSSSRSPSRRHKHRKGDKSRSRSRSVKRSSKRHHSRSRSRSPSGSKGKNPYSEMYGAMPYPYYYYPYQHLPPEVRPPGKGFVPVMPQYNWPYPMRPPFGHYEVPKEGFETKPEEQIEGKKVETNGKNVEEISDEPEIAKAAKEELETENIMKGVSIKDTQVDTKLGKALNKFIQLYAPNHIDSILKTKP